MNTSELSPGSILFPQNPVLIVDDEVEIRKAIRMTLLLDGITNLFECSDGNEARGQIQHRSFSLVLLDLMMPGFSGIDLLLHIREAQPQTPVIVATGVADAEMTRRCREAGAFGYLTKPIDRGQLVKAVTQAMRLVWRGES